MSWMNVKVIDVNGEPSRDVELPEVFSTPLRSDLVQRAFWIIASHGRQPYGRDPMAGEIDDGANQCEDAERWAEEQRRDA